jgi:hypothetical protein
MLDFVTWGRAALTYRGCTAARPRRGQNWAVRPNAVHVPVHVPVHFTAFREGPASRQGATLGMWRLRSGSSAVYLDFGHRALRVHGLALLPDPTSVPALPLAQVLRRPSQAEGMACQL